VPETRALAAAAKAAADLADTAQREAKALAAILAGQRARIAAGVHGTDQLAFDLEGEEQRQRERDRDHWQRRLTDIEREIADEPAQVIKRYSIKARRIEPIGVVYLWPATG